MTLQTYILYEVMEIFNVSENTAHTRFFIFMLYSWHYEILFYSTFYVSFVIIYTSVYRQLIYTIYV